MRRVPFTIFFASACVCGHAWGQAAVPMESATDSATDRAAPESLPSDTATAESAPAEPVPAAPPPPPASPTPEPQPTSAPPPNVQFDTAPAGEPAATTDNANVTQVGALPSPRRALYLGLGLGGGRIQDATMGHGGFAFDLNAGFSFSPMFSLAINFGGLYHGETEKPPEGSTEEDQQSSVAHYGIAAGGQVHLVDVIRLSLSAGYYALSKDGPNEARTEDDEDADAQIYWSPGGELGAGVEFFQTPGGFALALDIRSQLSFPNQELVWDSYALLSVRWYGLFAGKG